MIVVPWNPALNIQNASKRWTENIRWRGEILTNVPANLMNMMQAKDPEEFEMRWSGNTLKFLNHHECHSAFSFYQSPFKDANIVSIDGRGEQETLTISKAKDKSISKMLSIDYPHSIGLFYSTFTDFLGFKVNSDEWKVMSLASYSKKKNRYDNLIKKIIKKTPKGFELDLNYFSYYTFDKQKYMFSKKFAALFGKPREKNSKILKKHQDIAGAMQRVFIDICKHIFLISKKLNNSKNLVFTGGSAMNSVLNGRLDNFKIYKNSYISYAPDDSGVAIGAALLVNFKYGKKVRKIREVKTNYFGPSYKNNEIEKYLLNSKVNFTKPKNIHKEVAMGISKGNFVGWFNGKMEFGPRALGNRSILADPRVSQNKRLLNFAVKFREGFRPFAPAVLKEFSHKIFEIDKKREVNFMERVYKIRKNWRTTIPAVTHVDNTGRLQTVSKNLNSNFYELISEFHKITNIPLLLNTSFNLNDEPIVMSPNDAIRSFYSSGLDWLVLGPYLIKKNLK
jgi:carbamoyltransferase